MTQSYWRKNQEKKSQDKRNKIYFIIGIVLSASLFLWLLWKASQLDSFYFGL